MGKEGLEAFRKKLASGSIPPPSSQNKTSSNPKGIESFKQRIKNGEIDLNKISGAADYVMAKNNPLESTGFEKTYNPETKEFDQGLMLDFASGVWNSFIIGGGEGLANLVPTIAQAAGSESEIFSNWKSNVSDWFGKQETIYSDKANLPIEKFGDITAEHTASALGQGVGFILGIMGGSSVAGAVGSGTKAAGRIGSFVTGTTLMYPAVDKEAKAAGLSDVDASRFALSVSSLVSLTEGAALEWIGKIATKPLTAGLAKETVKEALMGIKTPVVLEKAFLESFSKKMGSNIAKIAESSSVEFGQEFAQTYIEEGSKQLYDIMTDGKDKGHFGSDVTTYKTFTEATYGGIIGAIIGGGLASTHIAKGKIQGSIDTEDTGLLNQSLFGYINTSIQNKKTKNIDDLHANVDAMVEKQQLTKDEAIIVKDNINSLTDFAKDYGHTGIKNNTALYQMFQLDGIKKNITSSVESIVVSDSANESVKKIVEEKKGKVELVTKRVQEHFDSILEKGKPETKDKEKFDEKLVKYNEVVKDINENNIYEETISKKLDKIYNPSLAKKESVTTKENESKKDFGKTFKVNDTVNLTEAALNDKKGFTELYNKAINTKEDSQERAEGIKAIEDTYGLDKDSAVYLMENLDTEAKDLEEVKPTIKPIEKEVTSEIENATNAINATDFVKQVQTQSDLTEKDLDAIQLEADTKELSSPELIDAIAKRRESIVSNVSTSEIQSRKENLTEKQKEHYDTAVQAHPNRTSEDVSSLQEMVDSLGNSPSEIALAKGVQMFIDESKNLSKEPTVEQEKPTSTKEQEPKEELQVTDDKTTDKEVVKEEPKVEKTKEEIQSELDTNDTLTPEERKVLTDKQAKENADVQMIDDLFSGTSLFSSSENESKSVKEQRSKNINDALLIKNNPILFNKIKSHFKKIFPHIPVHEINELEKKYGASILARLVERGIEIDPNNAIQTSLIHEYAHIFLEVLGENNPLVKLGYRMIEGTQFDLDAKRLYPDKTRAEQLNEAITEAIATNSLAKLEQKFDATTLSKFKEFLKRFWNRISRFFTGANQQNILDILSDGLTFRSQPLTVELSSLVGMNKNQRKQTATQEYIKNLNIIQEKFHTLHLDAIENKTKTNVNNQAYVTKSVLLALMETYNAEKNGIDNSDTKLFKGIDLGTFEFTDTMTNQQKFEMLNRFESELNSKAKSIFDDTNAMIKELYKVAVDISQVTEEDLLEEQSQDDTKSGVMKNEIKGSKKMNVSVQSLLSSLLDFNGKQISPDMVFSYVAHAAENSYRVEGLMEKLNTDSKNGNVVANRLLTTINMLKGGRKAGFLQTISSLIQVESEASHITIETKTIDGTEVKYYKVTNPTVNKDKTLGGELTIAESKLNQFRKNKENITRWNEVFDFRTKYNKILEKDADTLNKVASMVEEVFGIGINESNIESLIEDFGGPKKFYNAMASDYYSFKTYFLRNSKEKGLVDFNNINNYTTKIVQHFKDLSPLQKTYLNGNGNAESSTQSGHSISDLNSELFNTNRMEIMQKSIVYKTNSVLQYFKDKGRVAYAKLDSMKNLTTNEVIEYNGMNSNDYHINQLHKFATNTSNDFYKQSLGVISNRDGMLMFEVPTYTNEKLKEQYVIQAKGLQAILNNELEGRTAAEKNTLIKDFNKLYIHKASLVDGKAIVTSGMEQNHTSEIKVIKDIVLSNNLMGAFDAKIKNRTFKNMDELLNNYFYTEALNRIYLNDIYAGPAIYFSDKNSSKGAVESAIKRMSGTNSNGNNIELKKPVTFVVYKGMSMVGTKISDSFAFYGKNINKEISEFTGSFSKVGLNAKNNIFQIDPTTGRQFYVKSSNLNVSYDKDGKSSLDGFDSRYAEMANILSKIEEHLSNDANVVLVDKDAFKGNFNEYEAIDINELISAVKEDKIKDIQHKFTKPLKIDGLKTPFNLNKKLSKLSEQEAILSTQAMLIQFNNATTEARLAFENVAIKYLNSKMGGEYQESKTFKDLLDYQNVTESLSKDLNDREKSITTDILNKIKEYNKANPNKQIISYDDPSIRLIYEQHVASKLGANGIKIDLPGNFLHQLPDINDTLEHDEVMVPWVMFANSLSEANTILENTRANGSILKVAVVRIPASAEMSMFAGKVKGFLDTDANVVMLSNGFVKTSDSDHDGDKAMVYRQEIDDNGLVKDFSLKSQMFNKFYANLKEEQFVENSLNKTLNIDTLKGLSEKVSTYESKTVNDVVDIAQKMGLGQEATGRFAIASKLMSLLSQSKSSLKETIQFRGKTLKEFTNKELSNVAILLQAALDIGNNPVLTETGFTKDTIDVGNAMLLLGIDVKEVISFLQNPEIESLIKKFEKGNSVFSEGKKQTFKSFINGIKFKYKASEREANIVSEYGQNVLDFINLMAPANDLSKVISFIQLDKSLPNNSALNQNLLKSISEFKDLSFNMDGLMGRPLYEHRAKVLTMQSAVYENNLVTSNPVVKKIIQQVSNELTNSFEFEKNVSEQILHYLAQSQLYKTRDNAGKFINDFSTKMQNIFKAITLNETAIETSPELDVILQMDSQEQLYDYYESLAKTWNVNPSVMEEKYRKELEDYYAADEAIKQADKFKGNSVFDFLQFKEDNGQVLVSLNPAFKATTQLKQQFQEDFLKLQELDPELARDLIDYQLYRFGMNNKIGSFIEGLPTDLNINVLAYASDLIRSSNKLQSLATEIGTNLILKNKELLKKVDTLENQKEKFINYNNEVYKRNDNGSYSKYNVGKFESNNNFTAYNVGNKPSAASQSDINNLKNNC